MQVKPFAVRSPRGQSRLDFVVANDSTLAGVDEEHTSGLKAALLDDFACRHIDDTDLARHDDHVVVGYPIPAWSKPVAV